MLVWIIEREVPVYVKRQQSGFYDDGSILCYM